jgi:hypothetical protein
MIHFRDKSVPERHEINFYAASDRPTYVALEEFAFQVIDLKRGVGYILINVAHTGSTRANNASKLMENHLNTIVYRTNAARKFIMSNENEIFIFSI